MAASSETQRHVSSGQSDNDHSKPITPEQGVIQGSQVPSQQQNHQKRESIQVNQIPMQHHTGQVNQQSQSQTHNINVFQHPPVIQQIPIVNIQNQPHQQSQQQSSQQSQQQSQQQQQTRSQQQPYQQSQQQQSIQHSV